MQKETVWMNIKISPPFLDCAKKWLPNRINNYRVLLLVYLDQINLLEYWRRNLLPWLIIPSRWLKKIEYFMFPEFLSTWLMYLSKITPSKYRITRYHYEGISVIKIHARLDMNWMTVGNMHGCWFGLWEFCLQDRK